MKAPSAAVVDSARNPLAVLTTVTVAPVTG
jgi:hypothetical protein